MIDTIQEVLNELAFLGERYAVGGSVRDELLGLTIHDVDVATPYPPSVVAVLAQRHGLKVVATGEAHGTLTLFGNGLPEEGVEVTTYRADLSSDGRHAEVGFVSNLTDDLSRRDFTTNAMARSPEGELFDPFGGQADLEAKTLRAVGNARERFGEDYLRVVRAVRFAARYDLNLSLLESAISEAVPHVSEHVSPERFVSELQKGLGGSGAQAATFVRLLYSFGLLSAFVPEFAGAETLMQNPRYHPEGSVLEHTVLVVEHAPARYRLHALLHDVGKMHSYQPVPHESYNSFHGHEAVGADLIPSIGARLRLSKVLIAELEATTRLHMLPLQMLHGGPVNIRRFHHRVGDHLSALEAVVRADRMGRPGISEAYLESLFTPLPEPVRPILQGRDLLARGHNPSPAFTKMLAAAFEYQLEHGETDREMLYQIALDAS